MPWVHKGHNCKVPFSWFKPLGSKWQCSKCRVVWILTADIIGKYFEREKVNGPV